MNIKTLLQSTFILAGSAFASISAQAGFSVSGSQLLDDNGNAFVMRGINHAHAWYPDKISSISDIAATGANTVRVVLSDGQQWSRTPASEVLNIINQCESSKLICVLEVHDATGSGESSGAGTLANTAKYWVDIASTLKSHENSVIINIANEPFGNSTPASTWISEHQAAIKTIRNAGLTHTLMVDAANWGQDWEGIMLNNASKVASADTLSNTIFSVHMYEVYQSYSKIENYVSSFLSNHNLPLVVGEFGSDHQGAFVDADSIMAIAEEMGIGYLGWSWSGNGSCCTALDIANSFNANSLTPWGDRLVNGDNGLKSTSTIATIYGGSNPPQPTATPTVTPTLTPTAIPTPTPTALPTPTQPNTGTQCNWYGSLYPVCQSQTSGWGWESNQTCVSANLCSSQDGNGGIVGTATPQPTAAPTPTPTPIPTPIPTPTISPSMCDWQGNAFPICANQATGWGWENNQSCVGGDSCAAQSSGNTCNWYGSEFPLCTTTANGWGWENNQSCIAKTTCASQ